MNNNDKPLPNDDEAFDEAFGAYHDKIMSSLYQYTTDESIAENDDAIIEMISDYFGDGSDPMDTERAESKIFDGLGLSYKD